MKDIIERLKSLNKIDIQLQTLKKDMERLPKQLLDQQKECKALQANVDRAREMMLKQKLEAERFELEVKSGEAELKRLATQMNILKTSKEFDAVRRQMDAQRIWNKENEEKTLQILEKVDGFQKEIDKNISALSVAEKKLFEDNAVVAKDVAELKVQFDALFAQREKLTPGIEEKELTTYNRVVASRGIAIATVDRGTCSGCYMKVPAQTHNLALLGKEMVCCPSCGRILTASVETA
jgi:predicted  nucleic acid-binding Zn-ribbon protein